MLCISLLLCSFVSLSAHNIIVTGAPKSGISALVETVCELIGSKRKGSIPGEFLLQHHEMAQLGSRFDILVGTPVCNEHNRTLVQQYNPKIIYITRDPRDQLCSTAKAIYDNRRHIPAANNKSYDQIIYDLITEGGQYYSAQYPFDEIYHLRGIGDLYAFWTPWLDEPNVLVVQFEKLTGQPHERAAELRRIATFLELNLSDTTINKMATSSSSSSWFGLFKKEPTHGIWRRQFKAEHAAAFATHGVDACKQLGYDL